MTKKARALFLKQLLLILNVNLYLYDGSGGGTELNKLLMSVTCPAGVHAFIPSRQTRV